MTNRFLTIGAYSLIDLGVYLLLRWVGASETFAAFLVLAGSINAVRYMLEQRP